MSDDRKIISLSPRIAEKKQAELSGKKELSVRVRELEELTQRLIDRIRLQEEEIRVLSDRFWKVLRLIRKQQDRDAEDVAGDA